MQEKFLIVCEGGSDVAILESLAEYFKKQITPLAPQRDATSGTFPKFGFGSVLNWCRSNSRKIDLFLDFAGAKSILIHLDTDIAVEINRLEFEQGRAPRECCERILDQYVESFRQNNKVYYLLPNQNMDTWVLACLNLSVVSLENGIYNRVPDYEKISKEDLVSLLSMLGVGKGYDSYKDISKSIIGEIERVKLACSEFMYLCSILE